MVNVLIKNPRNNNYSIGTNVEKNKIRNLINQSLNKARRLEAGQVFPPINLKQNLLLYLAILVQYSLFLGTLFRLQNKNFVASWNNNNNFSPNNKLKRRNNVKLMLWGMLIALSKLSFNELKKIFYFLNKYKLKVSHAKLVKMANLMNINLPEGSRNLFSGRGQAFTIYSPRN